MACSNAAVLVSSDEPFATASIVNSPDAFGSGNALTPLARMHSANLTALSRTVTSLLSPVPALLAVLVFPLLLVPPQPALITATMAIMARAASGRSVLVMVSPRLW
jgi:hypothetical protein